MNIFRRVLNKIFGIPPAPPEPERPAEHFPRPVSVSMRVSQVTKQDPMAQAIERAKRDAKKTAVKGSVGSASSSTTRPVDPLMDPLNPLSPISPLNPLNQVDPITPHRVHREDSTTISDSVRSSVVSHAEPVRHSHHDSGYSHHSSHDSGSSYDHSSSHSSHDSGSYDSGSSHSSHDSNW